MSKPITKDVIADAVEVAIENTAHLPPAEQAERAKAIALSDPVIKAATTPVPRLQSQTLQGIWIAGLGPLVLLAARKAGFELAEGDGAIIATALVSLAAGSYAWFGRETTTRRLSGWIKARRS